jgi:hypothetical protein
MNGYKVSIKREVVDALRDGIAEDFTDEDFVKNLDVSLEYPTTEIHYPRIMITLQEQTLKSAGVGHYEFGVAETGETVLLRHFRFEANLMFTIYALSAFDRDELSAILVGILAFPQSSNAASKFYDEIYDADFVDMQAGNDVITPSGDSVEDVPWDDPTRKVYVASYSIPIIGEFYTHENGVTLVDIRDIRLYPYRPDQQNPTGSNDPRDADVPWQPEPGPSWTP